LTAAATAIAVVPDRLVAMVRLDRDGTITVRAAIVAGRRDRAVARHGPKAIVAGLWAARDRIFAGAIPATGARHRCRCRKLT
jgi:hypothetical protein